MANIANKFMDRMFKKVGGLVWELTTGKLGIKDESGIYTIEIGEDGAQIVVNPFDTFGVDIPAFATSTTFADAAIGDIIVGDTKILGWIVEKKEASFVLLDKSGMRKQYNPPKVAVLGTGTNVLIVKNLLNLTGGQEGLAGMQNNLMPLLLLGDGLGDMDDMVKFMLFSQTSGTAGAGMANLLPLMLMKKGGLGGGSKGGIDPMMLMMMGGMGGAGAGAMNPMMMMALMGDGFGSSKEAVTLQPTTPALQRISRN